MSARQRVLCARPGHTLARWSAFLAAVVVVGCGGTSPGDVGCVKDIECKGNRVCRQGMCVDPVVPATVDALPGAAEDAGGLPGSSLDGPPAVTTPLPDAGSGDSPGLPADAGLAFPDTLASLDTLALPMDSGGGPVDAQLLPPGDAGTPVGGAVAKLCNELKKGSIDFTVTVLLGPPQNPIRLSALSGTCSPPTGMACTPIPTGDVPYVMLDGTEELDRGVVRQVAAGEEILLVATLNMTTGAPMVQGGPLKPEFKCADVVF